MGRLSRRAVLAAAGSGLLVPLAGCVDGDDPEPGLHAVDALVIHRRGDPWYDYPSDVGVRVTVENTDVDRHRGVLVVTLRAATGDGEWTRERDLNLAGGTTVGHDVVFEAVADSAEAEFEASATIRSTDG